MKKTLIVTAVLSTATLSMTSGATAAVVLAHWTFEKSVPTTAGPHQAELGLFAASSFATAFHASDLTVYSNPVGNGSLESFSSNNWSIGDYYQFTTSTVGYESLTLSWAQTRSSTGPGTFMVHWSLDGITFNDLLQYDIPVISWSSINFNPESVFDAVLPDDLRDQAAIFIRLTNLVEPGGAAGTNRVDDIIITGTLIPAPGALALLGVAGLIGYRRRRSA